MIERERADIKCEIVEHIGILNSSPTGWTKEFNLVRWNDRQEKYDIRDWSPGHERMSRGVTLHPGEMKKLMELYSGCVENKQEDGKCHNEILPEQTQPVSDSSEVPF